MGDDEERTIHDIKEDLREKQQAVQTLQEKLLDGEIEPDEYEERYEQLLDEIHALEEEAGREGHV